MQRSEIRLWWGSVARLVRPGTMFELAQADQAKVLVRKNLIFVS